MKIYIRDQKTIITRLTMKAIFSKLPGKEFVRVHRSFIIPFSRIRAVRNKIVTLPEKQIPVGGLYEDEFYKRFKK